MPHSIKDHSPTILIFLKAPRVGYVKTRLAKDIGAESALNIYKMLVERQLSKLPSHYPLEVHYAPEEAREEMQAWLGERYTYHPQCSGGLGLRLENAVADAFDRDAKGVVCIGGDCPGLELSHLEQTAAALQSGSDVVFGPSEDGGYYLVGLNAPYPELFQSIPWSTPETLEKSVKQATKMQLRVQMLQTLYDIDEIDELKRAVGEGLLNVEL